MSKSTIKEVKNQLMRGSVITAIRPSYSNSVHSYTVIEDAGKKGRPYRLLSSVGVAMSGFETMNPSDAIEYIENTLQLKIVKVETSSETLFYHAEKVEKGEIV